MPSWWVESSKEEYKYADSFEKTFGFAHSTKYARRAKGEAMELYNSLTLYLPAGSALDVGEFATLYSFYESGRGSSDGKGVISFGPESEEKELDFTIARAKRWSMSLPLKRTAGLLSLPALSFP